MNKVGQMTIWIIIAIVLVATVVVLFAFLNNRPKEIIDVQKDPAGAVEKCVKKYLDDSINIILPQGGFIEPKKYKIFNSTNVSYLCYNSGSYLPCVNQHPMLMEDIKSEILSYVKPEVEGCFSELKTELENKNLNTNFGVMNLSVEMAPGRVKLLIDRQVKISKGETSETYDKFDVNLVSPLYDLVNVATEIVNNEAKYCYFEYVGYMLLYPEIDIKKFVMSDSTKIYTIEDKQSKKLMNLAIRSCAIPPGLGI